MSPSPGGKGPLSLAQISILPSPINKRQQPPISSYLPSTQPQDFLPIKPRQLHLPPVALSFDCQNKNGLIKKKSPIPLVESKTRRIFAPANASPDGGIGRRAGLKHQWSNPSRFDPGSGYNLNPFTSTYLWRDFSYTHKSVISIPDYSINN